MRAACLALSAGFLLAAAGAAAAPLATPIPKEARRRVLAAAEGLRGTPYRFGGLQRTGLDCSGLVYLSFQDALRVSVPRTARELYAWAEPVVRTKMQPGDLVFFNTTGTVSHVGIYAGENRFIHAASEGPATGVIYSSLDESYWRRAFIGAGRALPAEQFLGILLGAGAAPTWGILGHSDVLRGAAFQLGAAYDISVLGRTVRPGLELRPEWDGALGVFRLPLTLSIGLGDELRFFAGPAFSFGDAELETADGDRPYTAGDGFFSSFGVAWAPISFRLADGKAALFGEAAWQTYTRGRGLEPDWSADLAANLRISAGLRYRWGI